MTNKRKTLRTGEASQQQVLRSEAPPGTDNLCETQARDRRRGTRRDTETQRGRGGGRGGKQGSLVGGRATAE